MKEVPFLIFAVLSLISLIGGLLTSCVVYIKNMLDPSYRVSYENLSTVDVFGATILLTITFGVIATVYGHFSGVFDKEDGTSEEKTNTEPAE
jgi:hypothetical protein